MKEKNKLVQLVKIDGNQEVGLDGKTIVKHISFPFMYAIPTLIRYLNVWSLLVRHRSPVHQ